jgi:hypothetical protein
MNNIELYKKCEETEICVIEKNLINFSLNDIWYNLLDANRDKLKLFFMGNWEKYTVFINYYFWQLNFTIYNWVIWKHNSLIYASNGRNVNDITKLRDSLKEEMNKLWFLNKN